MHPVPARTASKERRQKGDIHAHSTNTEHSSAKKNYIYGIFRRRKPVTWNTTRNAHEHVERLVDRTNADGVGLLVFRPHVLHRELGAAVPEPPFATGQARH